MADFKVSDLTAITELATGDLIYISEDVGGGSYESKGITAGNFDMVKGTRYYGVLSADPVSPTPADGDEYYNTVLDMKMFYDGSRSKWLSIESTTFWFARNGNTAAGNYYRMSDGLAYSSATGFYAPHNGTIIGLGYTRTDTDSATFEVVASGTLITGATLASTAIGGSVTTINGDFSSTNVLAARNQSGGNTTSNVAGWVRLRWRA
jgi:hypothetical protein